MSFNIAEVNEAIAAAVPDREALVFRDRRFTFAQLNERTRRLANALLARGVTIHVPRERLANWESGQDHVALYMYNGNEYLEAMLGVMKARAVPFNVNFRYVAEELLYLFQNSQATAIVYHASFAPLFAEVLPKLKPFKALLQVNDGGGHALLPGAVDYEQALAAASPEKPALEYSADDLYMLYTGGTTGMPKGVLWRQGDLLDTALAGRDNKGRKLASLDEYAERARKGPAMRYMPTPPFMHGAGQWVAMNAWHRGHTVVIQDNVERLDPDDILRKIETEKVNVISIVGDAFAKPMLAAMKAGDYDISSLTHIINAGAALTPQVKAQFLERLPKLRIHDTMGSSETGPQAHNVSSADGGPGAGRFRMTEHNAVLSEDLTRVLEPGHEGYGRFASKGDMPLGYLGDEEKTRRTFPVIDGVRYSAPGDRVKLLADGYIEFMGRDSFTINSGGEKIFAEEVEQAVGAHPDVADVVVASRPSERWGAEVVAVVQLAPGATAGEAELLAECEKHIARYKFPKAFIFVDKVKRGANGKADYAWAKELAAG